MCKVMAVRWNVGGEGFIGDGCLLCLLQLAQIKSPDDLHVYYFGWETTVVGTLSTHLVIFFIGWCFLGVGPI